MSATRTTKNSEGAMSTALAAEPIEGGGRLTRGAPEGYRAGRLDIDNIDMEAAKKFPKVLGEFYSSIMEKGTDYGTIPGTPKPSLWKNGAELLCKAFRMVEMTDTVKSVENFDPNDPFFAYVIKCTLWGEDGGFLGAGDGASNSKEPQYAYRWFFENQLPTGMDKSKLETRTVGEKKYRQYKAPIPKEEVFGLQNVVLKKAKKRAFVDAVLSATGASRIFTQDMADEDAAPPPPVKDEPQGPVGGPTPPAEPTAAATTKAPPAVEKPGPPAAAKATLASFDQVWMGFEQERDDGLVAVEPLPDGTIVIRKKSVATGDVLDALRKKIKEYGGKMVVDGEKGTYWTIPTPA